MRAPRIFCVWTALSVCAVVVIGAMAMLTKNVMATQRERELSDSRATLEEQTRLALWRMDAAGSAILLRENQRPADTAWLPETSDAPEVKLRFEVRGGELKAPGIVDGELKKLREMLGKNGDAAALLGCAAIKSETAWQAVPKDNTELKTRNAGGTPSKRLSQDYQVGQNMIEMAQRAKVLQTQELSVNEFNNGTLGTNPSQASDENLQPGNVEQIGSMRAVWIDNELFLIRQLSLGITGARAMQGVWLDAERVRQSLLEEISDLLPAARLVRSDERSNDPLALVSLPFRLERGFPPQPNATPFGIPLIAAWTAVLCALAAVAILVRGVMRLSERRASFVSAVTHELRTPLTTFRLYSDMLGSGAVKEEKQSDYLQVLSREADRLSHLVENVLAFSRIERGNARSNLREVTVAGLLEESRERLEARLETAGLFLRINATCGARVRVDTAAIEHILFNLIDNAAKYAAGGDPPEVEIQTRDSGRFVEIHVIDHGPGIPASEHGRIFRAFHKSAREAAESKPGVGLGLALSRRLAREQGGDLSCADGTGGRFILRLPRCG